MDTSALVSIQDLLRDHEEQTARAKRDAELAMKRADEACAAAAKRARDDEAQRALAAETAAEEKRHADARRAAELDAMKAAAIARATTDAAAAERASAARAAAEHDQRLASFANDKSTRRWRFGAVMSAIALGLALVAGTTTLKASHDRETAAAVEAEALRAQVQKAEEDRAKLAEQLKHATDPETIARLKAEIAAQDAVIPTLKDPKTVKPRSTASAAAGPVPTTSASTTTNAPCTCLEGDPFCDYTRHCTIIRAH